MFVHKFRSFVAVDIEKYHYHQSHSKGFNVSESLSLVPGAVAGIYDLVLP